MYTKTPNIFPTLPDRPDAALIERYREDGYLAFLSALTPEEVKSASEGAITDGDGKYSLSIPEGSVTLVYSFVGYEAQEVAGPRNVPFKCTCLVQCCAPTPMFRLLPPFK